MYQRRVSTCGQDERYLLSNLPEGGLDAAPSSGGMRVDRMFAYLNGLRLRWVQNAAADLTAQRAGKWRHQGFPWLVAALLGYLIAHEAYIIMMNETQFWAMIAAAWPSAEQVRMFQQLALANRAWRRRPRNNEHRDPTSGSVEHRWRGAAAAFTLPIRTPFGLLRPYVFRRRQPDSLCRTVAQHAQ